MPEIVPGAPDPGGSSVRGCAEVPPSWVDVPCELVLVGLLFFGQSASCLLSPLPRFGSKFRPASSESALLHRGQVG
jgi:hypothetical protein